MELKTIPTNLHGQGLYHSSDLPVLRLLIFINIVLFGASELAEHICSDDDGKIFCSDCS